MLRAEYIKVMGNEIIRIDGRSVHNISVERNSRMKIGSLVDTRDLLELKSMDVYAVAIDEISKALISRTSVMTSD